MIRPKDFTCEDFLEALDTVPGIKELIPADEWFYLTNLNFSLL